MVFPRFFFQFFYTNEYLSIYVAVYISHHCHHSSGERRKDKHPKAIGAAVFFFTLFHLIRHLRFRGFFCWKTCLSEKSSKPISHFSYFVRWPLKMLSMIECPQRREKDRKKKRNSISWKHLCGLKQTKCSPWLYHRPFACACRSTDPTQYGIELLTKTTIEYKHSSLWFH